MAATERRARSLALTAALLALSSPGSADDRAGAAVFVHTDDDGLTVVHPVATAAASIDEATRTSARYDADVVSAATIDVRTSASPRGFEETRHGLSLGVERDFDRTTRGGASVAFSLAPDHRAESAGVSTSIEDDRRTGALTLSANVAHEEISRAGDAEPMGDLFAIGGSLTWSTLLSSAIVVDLAAALEHQAGYLESPYRFVPIYVGGGQDAVRVPEEVPDARVRGALRAGSRIALTSRLFGRVGYRLHGDDWGIVGHTIDASLTAEPLPGWLATVSGRFYGQRGASFYDGHYATLPSIPTLRTCDRELAGTALVAGGVRIGREDVEWLGLLFSADVRAELSFQRYFDTPVLPERTALTAGIGISARR